MAIQVGSVSVSVVPDLTDFNRKMAEVGRNISATIQVDADTRLAEARIAELGQRSTATVNVDADDTEAAARIEELTRTRTATVNVDADTGGAEAKLAALGDSASRGGSGLSGMVGAALALGPALVPVAAGAVAAGAALGAMGAAGMAGAGVLAIAFKGVGNAVKLLGQQQDQQAAADASAASSAAQRAQAVVAAQRQMQSAQMALGDAQRSAAQQQISDAQAVQSAQQALGDAQRAAANQQISDAQAVQSAQQSLAQANDQVTIAQRALTDAQEAGRRELESFANNAADAALAQRQAVISLESAQANYSKTMSSSTATDIQRQQASLDVAKAQQSLTEANQRVTQSAQDNTKAQAAGVDGTPAVLSAQKQVTTAQDAQQKAAQNLANAQRKAADDQIAAHESISKAAQAVTTAERKAADDQISSRESIVRAQQGVAAAAEAMAAAQQQSATTTSAALTKTNDAVAKLDPTTRAFAEYLRGTWAPIWKQVQDAAAGGLLPGVQTGLEGLRSVMPQITGIVGSLAGSMGDLFAEAGRALQAPFWTNFLTLIGQTAGPLLSQLGHMIGNVVTGFAGILQAFTPMALQLGGGIEGLTAKFSAWGQGLSQSQGFHEFVNFIHDSWPAIKAIVENVGTAVGHLIQAGAGLSGPYLSLLQTFSAVLARLPVGVVEALVIAFSGFKLFQAVAGPISTVMGVLDKLGSSSIPLASSAAKLLSSNMGAVSAVLGPAAVTLTLYAAAQQDAAQKSQAWASALKAGGDAAATAQSQMAEMKANTDKASSGITGFAVAMSGGAPVVDNYKKAVQDAAQAHQNYYNTLTPIGKAQDDVDTATDNLSRVLADPNHTWAQAQTASANLATAQDVLRQRQDQVKVATQNTNVALEELISTQQTQASASLGLDAAILNTQNQIDNYKAHLHDATMTANDHKIAENQVEQSMLNVVDAAKKKADADGAGLSPAQLAQKEVAAQRDALDKLVSQLGYVPPALKGMYDQLNGPQATALANSQTQIDNLKDATKRLGDATNGLPYQHGIKVTADTQAARDAITGLTNDYHNYSINVGLGGMSAYAAADGGVLPGWSPGRDIHTFISPTGGSLALSGGEAIMRPEFTAAMGTGWINSVNAAAKTGGASGVRAAVGFADGGVWDPWSLVAKVGIDPTSLAEAKRALLSSALGPAISAGTGGVTWPQLDAIRRQLFPGSVLTSAYRAGANDYHGLGDAIDIGVPGNLQAGLMPIAATLARLYPNSTELIHNPNGSIKNGRPVPPSFWGPATWAEHANHVHWAMTPAATAATRVGLNGGVPTDPMGNVQIGLREASRVGWGGMSEWTALYKLWERESGWNNVAQNRTSSAFGIPQFLDSTWGGLGVRKTSDATTQIDAGLKYIAQRYGDPIRAWAHEQSVGWYDQGGLVPPGYHMLYNGTGGNEVIAPQQTFREVVNQMHGEAGGTGAPQQVTLQLDGAAVTDLLEGRVVTALAGVHDRMTY